MKKLKIINLIALLISCLIFIKCTPDETDSRRYPYKSGKILYENKVNEAKINQLLYFDDFGKKEVITSEIDMGGENVVMQSIYKEGYCYTSASTSNKVGKTKINRNEINHLGFFTITENMLRKENAKKIGEEIIGDKTCEIYIIKQKDYDMQLWVWDNLIMKLISNYRGSTMTRTIIEIEEVNDLSPSLFEVPNE